MSSSFINPLNFIKYFQEPKYTGFFKIELLKSSFVRPSTTLMSSNITLSVELMPRPSADSKFILSVLKFLGILKFLSYTQNILGILK